MEVRGFAFEIGSSKQYVKEECDVLHFQQQNGNATHPRQRNKYNRRELIQIGGLSLLGLNSFELSQLRAQSQHSDSGQGRKINSCIFVFLFGGPSHVDLWDMKPKAPLEVRGEFQPVSTNVSGIQLCEHLPKLAKQMDKFALLRSMTHGMPVHGPACSEMYTGREYFGPPTTDQATPEDWPSLSSMVSRFAQREKHAPPSIVLPVYSQFIGQSKKIAGQTGGRMGEEFDPVLIPCEPGKKDFKVEGFDLLPEVGLTRLEQRHALLQQLESKRLPRSSRKMQAMTGYEELAYSMLHQPSFRKALNLQRTKLQTREKYGFTNFGQSLLLARQLVEAGVSLVTVNFDDETKYDKRSPMWDTHHDNFTKLKNPLCPIFDKGFAALLEDLDQRGLLETTLVVATGEFGRTPRIGQFSQNAMTLKTGRDHWSHAFTVLLAGGGVRGGQVYGETTFDGGHIADKPVTPADLTATILHHLGIDSTIKYWDRFQQIQRPLSTGTVIRNLG